MGNIDKNTINSNLHITTISYVKRLTSQKNKPPLDMDIINYFDMSIFNKYKY